MFQRWNRTGAQALTAGDEAAVSDDSRTQKSPGHLSEAGALFRLIVFFLFRDQCDFMVISLYEPTKRLTENEMSDFSRLWHDGCVEAIIEAQDVD